ncbi:butyrophilin subfamily 2 member A2-like, partial [Pimephales promelas]
MLPIIIIIALLVNLLIETTESFTVVVPRDQTVARVGSTVTLPCWISPPENAEVLEIRWYRQEFSKPVLLYQHGKIIQEESFRNRSSLTLWSDQSGGLKDGDVSLRLEKLTVQDEGSFRCYISGESVYDSGEVVLKVIDSPDSPDSSDLWKALFFTLLICAVLGLVGLILYKYTQKNTIRFSGKKPEEQICEDGGMEKLTEEAVGEINIEELRKHAVKITIDQHYVSPNLIVSKDRKI